MKKRRRFSGDFKARVVLEVLSGEQSAAQVCRKHGIKTQLFSQWKQAFVEGAPRVFEGSKE